MKEAAITFNRLKTNRKELQLALELPSRRCFLFELSILIDA